MRVTAGEHNRNKKLAGERYRNVALALCANRHLAVHAERFPMKRHLAGVPDQQIRRQSSSTFIFTIRSKLQLIHTLAFIQRRLHAHAVIRSHIHNCAVRQRATGNIVRPQ